MNEGEIMAGRPNKYYSNVEPKLLLIEAWARNGVREEQICQNLDVSVSAWSEYKKEFPALTEALKNGREVIDTMVENALLKAALGYDYTEEELNKVTGEPIELRRVAHPNTTALIFWLKNRKPTQWRDKQEIDNNIGNKDGKPFETIDKQLKNLDSKELAQLEHLIAKTADSG